MSNPIISQLQPLQKKSNKWLNQVVVSYLQDTEKPLALVQQKRVANAQWGVVPRKGISSLSIKENCFSRRKVKTLSLQNQHIVRHLNTGLLGGSGYPVLTAALGIAGGAISAGAGLIFTVATTALNLGNTAQRVLARLDDEIWHVEEIGKEGEKPVYVSAYFIVDPYRSNNSASAKGWLIHEERHEILTN